MQICPPGKYGRVGRRGGVGVGTRASAVGASRRGLRLPASRRRIQGARRPSGGRAGWRPAWAGVADATDAGTPRCSIARVKSSSPVSRSNRATYQDRTVVTSSERQERERDLLAVGEGEGSELAGG